MTRRTWVYEAYSDDTSSHLVRFANKDHPGFPELGYRFSIKRVVIWLREDIYRLDMHHE